MHRKFCPFCGGTGIRLTFYPTNIEKKIAGSAHLWCEHCDAEGPSVLLMDYKSKEECIKGAHDAWNERAVISPNCRTYSGACVVEEK